MAQDPSVASLLQDDDKRGFTLIEMSIVLVIIGLIIGGILVGRDLIKAAEVTAQISQITKYNSAVNTFRNKYGGLPGDLNINLANQFGFITTGCNGAVNRNGNGVLEGASGPGNMDQGYGEDALFWGDISSVGLIEGTYSNSGAPALSCSGAGFSGLTLTPGTAYIGDYLPQGKIGYGTFVYVYSYNSVNWYGLSAITSIGIYGTIVGSFSTPGLPVIQAYNIDKKIDDGNPVTGSIMATYVNSGGSTLRQANAQVTDSATSCYNTTNNAYSISASANGGSGQNCALSFKLAE